MFESAGGPKPWKEFLASRRKVFNDAVVNFLSVRRSMMPPWLKTGTEARERARLACITRFFLFAFFLSVYAFVSSRFFTLLFSDIFSRLKTASPAWMKKKWKEII